MVEERAPASSLLAPYVALDLTSARGRLAGSILAHLGMRVLRPCRAPVPIGGSQVGYQAAAQAVLGLLAALYSREQGTGGGDLVDVSAQEAMYAAVMPSKAWWYLKRRNLTRSAMSTIAGHIPVRLI